MRLGGEPDSETEEGDSNEPVGWPGASSESKLSSRDSTGAGGWYSWGSGDFSTFRGGAGWLRGTSRGAKAGAGRAAADPSGSGSGVGAGEGSGSGSAEGSEEGISSAGGASMSGEEGWGDDDSNPCDGSGCGSGAGSGSGEEGRGTEGAARKSSGLEEGSEVEREPERSSGATEGDSDAGSKAPGGGSADSS